STSSSGTSLDEAGRVVSGETGWLIPHEDDRGWDWSETLGLFERVVDGPATAWVTPDLLEYLRANSLTPSHSWAEPSNGNHRVPARKVLEPIEAQPGVTTSAGGDSSRSKAPSPSGVARAQTLSDTMVESTDAWLWPLIQRNQPQAPPQAPSPS